MILHALEDDQSVAPGLDVRLQDAEVRPDAEPRDGVFDEPLDGLVEGTLNLAHADGAGVGVDEVPLDEAIGKEPRFAAAASAPGAFVAGRLEERPEAARGLNREGWHPRRRAESG